MQNIPKIQPIKVKEYEAMQFKYNMVPNLPMRSSPRVVVRQFYCKAWCWIHIKIVLVEFLYFGQVAKHFKSITGRQLVDFMAGFGGATNSTRAARAPTLAAVRHPGGRQLGACACGRALAALLSLCSSHVGSMAWVSPWRFSSQQRHAVSARAWPCVRDTSKMKRLQPSQTVGAGAGPAGGQPRQLKHDARSLLLQRQVKVPV